MILMVAACAVVVSNAVTPVVAVCLGPPGFSRRSALSMWAVSRSRASGPLRVYATNTLPLTPSH